MKILGICGSLRRQSLNRHALQVAATLMPEGMHMEMAEIGDLPLYNQDIEASAMPDSVVRLGGQLAHCDGVLISSPEYNFSITAALKNAIDWTSRLKPQPWKDKPVAMLSVTGGPVGGARSQYELRKVLGCLEATLMMRPEVFVGLAAGKFDAQGQLTDTQTRDFMAAHVLAFQGWVQRMALRS